MRFILTLCAALLLCLWFGNAKAAPTCWPNDIGGTGGPATYTLANVRGPAAGWHCPDNTDPLYAVRWGDVTADMGRAMEAVVKASDKQAAAAALLPFAIRSQADVFDLWQQWATWKPIAAEGFMVVNVPATGVVLRYGAGDKWVIKAVYADIGCSNAAFTQDPAPGVVKGCELAKFVGQPIPTPPPATPTYTHKVKPNGTAADRPVYPFANGVRGTTAISGMRAMVLTDGKPTPCDPSKAQASSGTSTTDVYAAYAPAFAASAVTLCTKQ